MTHDELLEKVKDNPTTRAVVELHKPEKGTLQSWFKFLHNKPVVGCRLCEDFYPCSTIQAIEKELG
jgi:hypothetical protein